MTTGPHHAGAITPAWCTGGQVENEFMLALLGSYRHPHGRVLGEPVAIIGGPRLHVLRTDMVREFLAGPGEWLWSIDADMDWEAEAPFELLRVADPVERPIVGGLCFGTGRSGGILFPTIFVTRDGKLRSVIDWERGALVECDATGFAFLLVHRSVLEKMATVYATTDTGDADLLPWFVDGQAGDALMEGDLSFCARARDLGFPIYVHTGVGIAHKKPQMLTEGFYDLVRELQEARRGDH